MARTIAREVPTRSVIFFRFFFPCFVVLLLLRAKKTKNNLFQGAAVDTNRRRHTIRFSANERQESSKKVSFLHPMLILTLVCKPKDIFLVCTDYFKY